MDVTSLHKFLSLNKMANGTTEVIFCGQPCLEISEISKTAFYWKINPIFAKLTYGANVITDVPHDLENHDSIEEATASGLMKLWELGAFRTMVDLPEDSYAATLAEGVEKAIIDVTSDYKTFALNLAPSIFEASKVYTKLMSGSLSIDLSEEIITELRKKLVENDELNSDEYKVILASLASGQTSFLSEVTGLYLGSKIPFSKFVEPEQIVETPEIVEEAIEEENPSSTSFIAWKASQTVLNESRKLTSTHENGSRSAKVYKDSETGEHVVKFYTDGKHHSEADYFGSDKEDAVGTAKHWINKVNESLNDDDYYQVHKDSKKITKHLGKRQVGFEHKDSPEKAPALADYCDKEHTVVTGMRAKMRGYTNEDRESEFNANSQLSGSTPMKKKIRLKTPGGSTISSHDSESDAMRAYKALKDSKGVKFVHEEDEGLEIDVTDWFIAEVKDLDDKYAKWEENVRKAHPEKELKFKGRVEKGVHTTSAEVSGKDRSYGVWDHDKNTGHIFEDEGEDILGEEITEEKIEILQEAIKPPIKPTRQFTSKYSSGIKAQ